MNAINVTTQKQQAEAAPIAKPVASMIKSTVTGAHGEEHKNRVKWPMELYPCFAIWSAGWPGLQIFALASMSLVSCHIFYL